jgi:hypothetical protein
MVAVSTTETWDAAWTLTMRSKRKRLTDNISDNYPLLSRLRRSGVLETETGGKEYQEDLMYALGTSEWFDGFDVLATDSIDGITAAFYQPRYNATPIVISMTEEMESRKAAGSEKLLTAKTTQAMTGAFDTINAAALGAQSGKSMLGLQDIVSQSTGTTVGGISASTNSWWDNGRLDFTTGTYTSFVTKTGDRYNGILRMGVLWNQISEGNDKPNLIVTSYANYGFYEDIFESTGYTRMVSSGNRGGPNYGLGAEGDITFRGAPVIPDRDCATDDLYMLNTKYLKLKVQSGLNFAKTPFKEPSNQMAKVGFVVVGLQLVTNHRARQGVLHSIA